MHLLNALFRLFLMLNYQRHLLKITLYYLIQCHKGDHKISALAGTGYQVLCNKIAEWLPGESNGLAQLPIVPSQGKSN